MAMLQAPAGPTAPSQQMVLSQRGNGSQIVDQGVSGSKSTKIYREKSLAALRVDTRSPGKTSSAPFPRGNRRHHPQHLAW
jgi:hypothetical protein